MRMVGAASTTAVGLAVAWWVYSRLTARAELENKLEESPEVFTARVYAQTNQLGPKYAWLTRGDGARLKAQQVITFTNAVTVADAYKAILAELPKIPQAQQVLPGLIGQGVDAISEALGVKVPRSVRGEVVGLAHTPQGQSMEGVVTNAQGLWQWQLGQQEQRR